MAPERSLLPIAETLLLATLDEGVVVQKLDGSVVFSNPAAERILGLSPEQLSAVTPLGPHWQARHEDGADWPANDYPIVRAMLHGTPTDGAIMDVRHDDGARVWMSINARPILDGHEIVGGIATFRDITAERHAADHASANERQLLAALLESGLAVATSNRDGYLISANDGFSELVGRPPSELVGMHFTDLSGPDALEDQLRAVERIRAGATDQFQTLKTYVRPDGSSRHALMNLLALRDSRGGLVRHVSLVNDTDVAELRAAAVANGPTVRPLPPLSSLPPPSGSPLPPRPVPEPFGEPRPIALESEAVLKWGGVGLLVLAVGFAVSTAISRGGAMVCTAVRGPHRRAYQHPGNGG